MRKKRNRDRRGFSLLEVALAIAVISFALVGLLALLPVGLQTASSSSFETRAFQIASQVVAQLRPQRLGNMELLGTKVTALDAPQEISLSADESGSLLRSNGTAPYDVSVGFFPMTEPTATTLQLRIRVRDKTGTASSSFATFLGP